MKRRAYILLGQSYSSMDYIGQIDPYYVRSKTLTCVYETINDKWNNPEMETSHLFRARDSLNKSDKDHEWNVYRVGSKKCPVKVDWKFRVDYHRGKVRWDRYQYRNLPFICKK